MPFPATPPLPSPHTSDSTPKPNVNEKRPPTNESTPLPRGRGPENPDRTASRILVFPHLPPKTVIGNFVSAEGASEEILEPRQLYLIQKLQNCLNITIISRLRRSHRLTNSCSLPRLPPKYFTVVSLAPKARAKKIWDTDHGIRSKRFTIAVKLRAFEDCANRTGRG